MRIVEIIAISMSSIGGRTMKSRGSMVSDYRQNLEVLGLSEGLRKVSIDSASPHWNEMSNNGKRESFQLSTISDDARRQSLFADVESQLTRVASHFSTLSQSESDSRKVRPDEVFTDKARAAMVVIGTKDIKESLDKKKKEEIFRKTPEAKSAAILYQQARFLMHQSRYQEALVFLNKALLVDPQRKEWLIERSQCYFKMLQPETALKYVDELLTLDPNYFQALLLKGEILYSLWDLERSMLCFVKGRRIRPENEDCILGVHKVRMALEEITEFRKSTMMKNVKPKFKRSKSAKERDTSWSKYPTLISPGNMKANESYTLSPKCSTPTAGRSSPSSAEARTKLQVLRPFTAQVRRRRTSASDQKGQMKDLQAEREESLTLRERLETPSHSLIKHSDDTSSDSWDDSIFSTNEEKTTCKSKPDLSKCDYNSEESICGMFKYSPSTTGEEKSNDIQGKEKRRRKKITSVRKVKSQTSQNSRVLKMNSVVPKIAPSLEKDKVFLENLLKDKDLKKTNTPHTKRVIRVARDLHKFVSERELYWENREHFIRHAKPDEDIFIA